MMQATERFEAVYPTLKEVALAGSPGSKAMKQVSQQILTISLKASGEGNCLQVSTCSKMEGFGYGSKQV